MEYSFSKYIGRNLKEGMKDVSKNIHSTVCFPNVVLRQLSKFFVKFSETQLQAVEKEIQDLQS